MRKLTGFLVLACLLCGCDEMQKRQQERIDALSDEDYQIFRQCVTVAQWGEADCLYRVKQYPARPSGPSRAGTGGDSP